MYPEVWPSLCFCVQFIESAYLELNLAQGDFPNTIAKVIQLKQRFLWASAPAYICLKVWLLSAFCFFCFGEQSRSLSPKSLSFRGYSLALLVGESKKKKKYLSVQKKKLIDTHSHTHRHALTYIHASLCSPYFIYSLMFPITLSNSANVLQRGTLIEMLMQPS